MQAFTLRQTLQLTKAWSECLVLALLACLSCPLPPSDVPSTLGILLPVWSHSGLAIEFWADLSYVMRSCLKWQQKQSKTNHYIKIKLALTPGCSSLQARIASCTFCSSLGSEHKHVCYALSMTTCHTVLMNAKTSQVTFETGVCYKWLFLLINFSALIEANFIIKRDSIFSCHHTPICIKSILWIILGCYLIFFKIACLTYGLEFHKN